MLPLYIFHALAARVYEIHLFTVPPDWKPHLDAQEVIFTFTLLPMIMVQSTAL